MPPKSDKNVTLNSAVHTVEIRARVHVPQNVFVTDEMTPISPEPSR